MAPGPAPARADALRVVVLGAGGVGGYFGGALARAGHDVTLLARGEHLAAIRARGLELRTAPGAAPAPNAAPPDDQAVRVRVRATDDPDALPEAAAVGRAHGVAVGPEVAAQTVAAIDALPAAMRPSFLLDLERGGPTELDVLSGAVSRLGRRHGVPTPVHDTAVAALGAATGVAGEDAPG